MSKFDLYIMKGLANTLQILKLRFDKATTINLDIKPFPKQLCHNSSYIDI